MLCACASRCPLHAPSHPSCTAIEMPFRGLLPPAPAPHLPPHRGLPACLGIVELLPHRVRGDERMEEPLRALCASSTVDMIECQVRRSPFWRNPVRSPSQTLASDRSGGTASRRTLASGKQPSTLFPPDDHRSRAYQVAVVSQYAKYIEVSAPYAVVSVLKVCRHRRLILALKI